MAKKYLVKHNGEYLGYFHAKTPEEAIGKARAKFSIYRDTTVGHFSAKKGMESGYEVEVYNE